MNETEFKNHFAVTFLASWAAVNYDDACIHSQHERLNHPPVDDAGFLAGKAWDEWRRACEFEEYKKRRG